MTGKIMPLRERDTSSVQAAADAFLSSPRYASPNTAAAIPACSTACSPGSAPAGGWPRSAGRSWPACWSSYGDSAPRRPGTATAAPWPPGCPGTPPAGCPPRSCRPAPNGAASTSTPPGQCPGRRSTGRCPRRDVPLREKTLWRILYETAARASEVLALNIEDLDLDARGAPIRSKGGDTEWICWGSGTAHLLPRLIRGRHAGPVFLSERRPGPARRPVAKDMCPATGRARLGYDRARVLVTWYTGWELHQLRHSAATHLGEQGIPLQLIMAKTRHRNPRTAMRYVRPGAEAVAEITALLEPPRRRG
jgi:Phage integrase family